jgi:uncharacterized membrane protein
MDKKKIEDLSNLVFGLALTIGAINLVKPDQDSILSLATVLIQFGLSFAIILWIWRVYNALVPEQDMQKRGRLALNVILLFLVVIEPFLLSVSLSYSSGRSAYAVDLGIILVVLALFAQFAIEGNDLAPTETTKRRLQSNRNLSLFCAALFFLSLVPQLLLDKSGADIQSIMWLSALLIGVAGRSLRR